MSEPKILVLKNRSAALDDLFAAFVAAQNDDEIDRLSREIKALEFDLIRSPVTNRKRRLQATSVAFNRGSDFWPADTGASGSKHQTARS